MKMSFPIASDKKLACYLLRFSMQPLFHIQEFTSKVPKYLYICIGIYTAHYHHRFVTNFTGYYQQLQNNNNIRNLCDSFSLV